MSHSDLPQLFRYNATARSSVSSYARHLVLRSPSWTPQLQAFIIQSLENAASARTTCQLNCIYRGASDWH